LDSGGLRVSTSRFRHRCHLDISALATRSELSCTTPFCLISGAKLTILRIL
jgi:hypothetical protein